MLDCCCSSMLADVTSVSSGPHQAPLKLMHREYFMDLHSMIHLSHKLRH